MQIDMHFYGTYAMARAAGLSPDVARVMATSAQFVDDAVETAPVLKEGGAFFVPAASCHSLEDATNLDRVDQCHVWLPYHFLPGNAGGYAGERLICRAGDAANESAEAIIGFALRNARKAYGVHLMGIVTHVLQDTFSHAGFVGMSSLYNDVVQASIDIGSITDPDLLADKSSMVGKLVELLQAPGHAAVGALPDYPYLKWSFQYEYGADVCPRRIGAVHFERDNRVAFAASCQRLHEVYCRFGAALAGDAYGGPNKEYREIREAVEAILGLEAHRDRRGKAWTSALEGCVFCDTEEDDNGVAYASEVWRGDVHGGENVYAGSDAVLFMQASHQYRAYVLSELLPSLEPRP